MINYLSSRNRFIACIMFWAFYLGLLVPVYAAQESYRVQTALAIQPKSIGTHRPTTLHPFQQTAQKDIGEASAQNDVPAIPSALNKLPETYDFLPLPGKENRTPYNKPFGPGPGQPEMEAFKAVGANDMVDLFSGDFSYNIPLLDVGGYPVNLSYTGGKGMDEEASWVGLGWNINPGAISRNVRGLPDDFKGNGDEITKTMNIKPNLTIGGELGVDLEIFGLETKIPKSKGSNDSVTKSLKTTFGLTVGGFYNNYKGWGTELGANVGISAGRGAKSKFTGGISYSNNSQNGMNINYSFSNKIGAEDQNFSFTPSLSTGYNSRMGVQNLQVGAELHKYGVYKSNEGVYSTSIGTADNVNISFAKPSFAPGIQMPYTSYQFTFRGKVGFENLGFHPSLRKSYYVSKQYIKDKDKTQTKPSYGYLYMQEAQGNENVLLDYNREKDLPLTKNSVVVGMPSCTYDVYSISGQGTGGMFRPYRGDVGYTYDHTMRTSSGSGSASIDFGFGNVSHFGTDFMATVAWSRSGMWRNNNNIKDKLPFKTSDSTYEAVYFKNPGEKTLADEAFQTSIGGEDLMNAKLGVNFAARIGLQNPGVASAFNIYKNGKIDHTAPVTAPLVKKERDKRTQVISYLKAEDAAKLALDKELRSYPINTWPASSCAAKYEVIPRTDGQVRKAHHLSEITVLNSNGGRYIYGLPAYNYYTKDATFATAPAADATEGLVSYTPGLDNSANNNKGIDHFYNGETVSAHAHSFLLTAVLSPDYTDVSGDGITDDDIGDAVKFNYSRIYGIGNGYDSRFAWRAPYTKDKASYNPGLKTDNRDDRGTYSYGEKEIWYLNSIESKNMIAAFVLDNTTRQDGYGVNDENGGQNSSKKLYRLAKINLYTKADFNKNGAAAKPVKTVHFDYDYSLCTGNPSSAGGTGKLTLKKVWFSYNNNDKGERNAFRFWYHSNNPTYNNKSNDRWGVYKNPNANPGTGANKLTNADYPYTIQGDSATAASNAAAWSLDSIKLPSGGRIKVAYESDDYAYVQNKRAMQMTGIAGFGENENAAPTTSLYSGIANDYNTVFVNISSPIASYSNAVLAKREIYDKYLEDVTMLYFKLMVKMPDNDNRYGNGYEMVPGYGKIKDYGVKTGSNGNTIWIKLEPVKGDNLINARFVAVDRSPFAVQAVQFLRLNLPYKAHPNSEIGDSPNAGDVIQSFGTVFANVKEGIFGFPLMARSQGWCKTILPENSFVRLNNPQFKKKGGGYRVKRVTIYDNWNNMSAGQQQSVYGQEYDYTTTKMINGVETRISSGVATYEPMVGNDENPLRLPVNNAIFKESTYPLGPTDYNYAEAPVGESYYPAPSVGYSKVTVQSVHKNRKSSNGTSVTEFYTAYDFPVKTEFTPFEKNKTRVDSKSGILKLLGWTREFSTVTQGFKVELNDMHGRMKSQAVYPQGDNKNATTYTLNYYKLQTDNQSEKILSNTVPVADSAAGTIRTGTIGKEIELMADFREHESYTISGNIQLNFDYFQAGPIPVLTSTVFPMPKMEQSRYRAVTISKIINRYALLDSVVVMDKGSVAGTRNMVYDAETGDVLLTKTNNEYNDAIYNFSYPAHWAYSGMGPAYKNMNAVYKNLVSKKGRLYIGTGTLMDMPRYFESGDEVWAYSQDAVIGASNTDPCMETQMETTEAGYTFKKLWVINAAKAREGNPGYFLIDRNGKYYTGNISSLRILRSGKRNMSSVSVGSITSLNSPVQTISGKTRFVFDANTGVVATGAAKFKDVWPVENRLRMVDSCVTYTKDTFAILPQPKALIQKQRITQLGTNQPEEIAVPDINDATSLLGSFQYFSKGFTNKRKRNRDERTARTLLKFDFTRIPAGATITGAAFDFTYWLPINLWDTEPFTDIGLSYSYEGVQELMNGYVTNYPFAWDGLNPNPVWDHTPVNTVDTRAKTFLPWVVNTNDTISYHNADATTLVQQLITKPENERTLELRVREEWKDPGGSNTNQVKFMGFSNYYNPHPGAPNSFVKLKVNYRQTVTQCYKKCISDIEGKDTINPYLFGIWGNWRGDRAYTYYADRKESDPATATNIRKDGQILNFAPYWTFSTGNYLQPATDETRWVWNSEIKMLNRKGFDIENRDPLNRYNAGIYGYRQHLPVAVAQNSKQREIAFDGFEDYDYNADTCINCAQPLWIDHKAVGGQRVENTAHTGKYSLKLNGSQTVTVPVSLVTRAQDSLVPNISIANDTVFFTRTVITPNGSGLASEYWNTYPTDGTHTTGPVTQLNHDWGNAGPFNVSSPADNFKVEFKGKIQPKYTGNYTLYIQHDDGVQLYINDVQMSAGISFFTSWYPGPYRENRYSNINMVAGQTYRIKILYREDDGAAAVKLFWSSNLQAKEIVPQNCLYTAYDNTIPSGTITTVNSVACIKPRHPKPENMLLPKFAPINGTTLVFSAWVREEQLCLDKYSNVQVTVSFNDGSSTTKTCKPSGNIIEGWQRIEEVIHIPAGGTVMNVQLQSLNNTIVYFDDIRFHPFNSNMKSFVYNPVNLRLMAELDENNYASFYEYDDDGTLIRVKKETERGVKTIQETRSALIKD